MSSRAGLSGGIGKLLGAATGLIRGALSIMDGYQDIGLSRVYGVCMIVIGLVVAIITLIVACFKPTKIQKWLDASYHRQHKSRKFDTLQDAMSGLQALGEED